MPVRWKVESPYKGIFLEGNPLDPALVARIQQGNAAVIDYYQELANSKETEELYEARLMIIGEPRAGKTTLQRKLRDIESALPLDTESTEGISTGEETDIDTYKSQFSFTNEKGQTVPFYYTIWDFGGQRQYHPSHQLFFAKNAVYLLVTNTNWNKNEEDVEYWLSTVRKLGIDSPVLRVSNMPNDRPDDSDWSLVEQVYGKMIKDVFPINLKRISQSDTAHFDKNEHKEFIRLKRMIEFQLTNLAHIGSTVPKVWTDIRKALTTVEGNPPYISWADFVAICKRFHYDDPVRQQRLSQTFHDLGIFLHYQNNPVLKDTVILKNKWAIDAVFAVVDSRLIGQQKGAFTDNDLPTIWSKPTYRGKEQELLNLLKEFELCYPLSGHRGYVAPQRLPKAPPPQYEWNHADNVRVDIEYDFLPRTVIIRLIVKLHQHIHEDKNWVWQNGVVISGTKLNYPDTYARIQENYKQKTLSLQLRGAYSEDLFKEIQSKLSDIYDDFPKLEVEYHIYCNCEDCKLSPRPTRFRYYDQLLHYRRVLNRDTIECQTKGKPVQISQILRGIVSAEQATKDSRHGTYIENLHIGDWVGGDKIGRDKIGGG
jgi:GTPase SAR1 family protein